jgi:DNA-binding MarR family transcriptional regulator
MSSTAQDENDQDEDTQRIMLGLLQSVERDGGQSQRRLAAELGIALGLVNAYLKRCIKKGLVKVSEAPARRYAYYLTPHGFAEKSRLTVEYLGYSFSFFRQARAECAEIFSVARSRAFQRVVVAGVSDLAEIARICALESGIEIVAMVDAKASSATFVGVPVAASYAAVEGAFDAVVVTDLGAPQATYDAAAAILGPDRVLAPKLLGVRPRPRPRQEATA